MTFAGNESAACCGRAGERFLQACGQGGTPLVQGLAPRSILECGCELSARTVEILAPEYRVRAGASGGAVVSEGWGSGLPGTGFLVGPLVGFHRLSNWVDVPRSAVFQKVWIYEEGWTYPRCSGAPDTWRFTHIREMFRVQNGTTRLPGTKQILSDGRLQVTDGYDLQKAVFDSRSCPLCRYRFQFWSEWQECDSEFLPDDTSYAEFTRYVRGRGCLMGADGVEDGDTGERLHDTELRRRGEPRGSAVGVFNSKRSRCLSPVSDGWSGVWSICPCVGPYRLPEPIDPDPVPSVPSHRLRGPITPPDIAFEGEGIGDARQRFKVGTGWPPRQVEPWPRGSGWPPESVPAAERPPPFARGKQPPHAVPLVPEEPKPEPNGGRIVPLVPGPPVPLWGAGFQSDATWAGLKGWGAAPGEPGTRWALDGAAVRRLRRPGSVGVLGPYGGVQDGLHGHR
jgi:hypothetical protein